MATVADDSEPTPSLSDIPVCLPSPPGPVDPVDLEFLIGTQSHLNILKLHQDYGDVCAVKYEKRSECQCVTETDQHNW